MHLIQGVMLENSLVRFSMAWDETTPSLAWLLCGRKRLALIAKKLVRSTCSKSILPLSNQKFQPSLT